ncbi:D-xylose-proton symporter [compost metagenome]
MVYGEEDTRSEESKKAILKKEESANPVEKQTFQKWMLRPLLMCIFFVVIQKYSGASPVLFYTPTMLEQAGIFSKMASFATIGIGFIIFLFTFIGVKFVDNKGRKFLLILGNIIMGADLLALGILTKLPDTPGILLVIMMYIFIAGFGIGWGSVPWIVVGEFLPMAFKGTGSSIVTGIAWFSDALLAFIFPILLSIFHIDNVFLIFGAINILSSIFISKQFTETKGKTQTQIDYENEQYWKAKHVS